MTHLPVLLPDGTYHGLRVKRTDKHTPVDAPPVEDSSWADSFGGVYGDLTLAVLRNEAKRRGLAGISRANRSTIIDRLEADDEA